MKCLNCNTEFNGNFCPTCGAKKQDSIVLENNKNTNENEPQANTTAEEIKSGISDYWSFRLKFVFIGAFLGAFCYFVENYIFIGILFAVSGVLICPFFLKKLTPEHKKVSVIVGIVLMAIALLIIYMTNPT